MSYVDAKTYALIFEFRVALDPRVVIKYPGSHPMVGSDSISMWGIDHP